MKSILLHRQTAGALIIASLGYFVDIYDLLLFGFVRIKSLKELGFSGQELTDVGISLLNWQMAGMLIGGVIWGILGDKRGRVSVLYFSIFLYSAANFLNGFASGAADYAAYRFIAGLGLAGELGAGITLVAEILPKEKRGYGTMVVATVGLFGALFAWLIDQYFHWRTCYFIGGGLGIALLILRISVSESAIFHRTKATEEVRRGDFLALFTNRDRFVRFMRCILIGAPTWFVVGILVTLSPEFGQNKGLSGILPGHAIAICYTGLIVGDISSGLLSQWLRSRVRVMWIFLLLDSLAIAWYLGGNFVSAELFYVSHFFLGVASGFWVIFVTIGAEQFGTNLRATVATSVPNFARGMLVPISAAFVWLKSDAATGNPISAAWIVGGACMAIAVVGLAGMRETFGVDLDYSETI